MECFSGRARVPEGGYSQLAVGSEVSFDEVLLSGDGDNIQLGTPKLFSVKF